MPKKSIVRIAAARLASIEVGRSHRVPFRIAANVSCAIIGISATTGREFAGCRKGDDYVFTRVK